MLIELNPVSGDAFDIEESNIHYAENFGDNVLVSYKQPSTYVMQRIEVTDTIEELNDTSVGASGKLFATEILVNGDENNVQVVLLNQDHVKKVFDTDPCEVNYNLGSASIYDILYHNGDKDSFEADYDGGYSPSVSPSPSASESGSPASPSPSASESVS